MWRPDEVVQPDKRKATTVWIGLILSISAYATYLVYQAEIDKENPSTNFELSNLIYKYPNVWACLYDNYGCDDYDLEETCAMSMNVTAGGATRARYHPGDDEQNISVTAGHTEPKGWCVQFETSAVTTSLDEERDPANYLNYVLFDIYWHPGGENDSTTCITEEGEWQDHSENIFVFLHDPETNNVSTGIQVPYSCITNQSSSHVFTYVGIGLTVVKELDGEIATSYKALATASSTHKFKKNESGLGTGRPYAYVAMELEQEPESLQILTEINPLNILEILGSVGGFWDLILILWPLFFVAAIPTSANMKMRNFKDIALSADTVKSSIATRFSAAGKESMTEADEELPHWEKPAGPGGEVLIRLFDDHGLVGIVNGGAVKKFLKTEMKAISLKTGADEPGLQKLLPANTYLVVVPPNSSTVTVAKAVMDRCAAGGDSTGENDSKPIRVKVKRVHLSVLQSHALSSSPYVAPSNDIGGESDVVMDQWNDMQNASPSGKHLFPVLFPKRSERPYANGKTLAPWSSPPV